MNRIGERIKKKREQFNLQLNELAEKIGISPRALSQIEKTKSFPFIITLKTIAEKLHTTVGELIGENDSLTNNPVVFKSDIKFIDQSKYRTMFYLLSQHDANKYMDTYLVRFSKASEIDSFLPLPLVRFFLMCFHAKFVSIWTEKVLFLSQAIISTLMLNLSLMPLITSME